MVLNQQTNKKPTNGKEKKPHPPSNKLLTVKNCSFISSFEPLTPGSAKILHYRTMYAHHNVQESGTNN